MHGSVMPRSVCGMTTPQRCTVMVPEVLCVDLSRSRQCSLIDHPDGTPHTGDHRATVIVPKVGRITYRWKRARLRAQPPVIDLPTPLASIKRS